MDTRSDEGGIYLSSKLRHNLLQKAKKAKSKAKASSKLTSLAGAPATAKNGTSTSTEEREFLDRGIVTKPGKSGAFTITPNGPFSRSVDEVLVEAVRRVLDDLTNRKEGQAQ